MRPPGWGLVRGSVALATKPLGWATAPLRAAADSDDGPNGAGAPSGAGAPEAALTPRGDSAAVAEAGSEGADSERPAWAAEVSRIVGSVAEDLRDPAAIEHLVEQGFELVEEVIEDGVELLHDGLGDHRRVWEDDDVDHAQIELHGVTDGGPEAGRLRRALQRSLEQLDEVQWAEVNALTSRVAVAFDGGTGTLAGIINAVETVEQAHGVGRRHRDGDRGSWDLDDRAEHPADAEPAHRAAAALAGSVASLGWSVIGRAARFARVPVEVVGIVPLVDHNPWLRRHAERVLGRRAADLVLPIGGALANGLGQGPFGALVDAAHHTTILTEVRARRRVWEQREPEFYAAPSKAPIEPPELEPRPVPFPKGPVEQWSERISAAALAAFAVTLAATRDPRRAADAFLAGMPKAARLGREAFAAQLGRTLAARGVVPLDAGALRRLDRVNTVVLDSDVLVTGRWEVGPVAVLEAAAVDDIRGAAERLLDPEDPAATRRDGTWTLQPFADVPTEHLPRGARARMREIRTQGARPLALRRRDEVVAVVGVVAELEAGTDAIVEATRRAGHRLVVAGRIGNAAKRVDADATIPRGADMGRAVRELQADGAVVAAVARRSKNGLAAAGVGIGLTRANGRPPWGADLLCGRDLAEATFLIDATTVAAQVSERSARFALAGSTLGALVALTGPRTAAGARCLAMVNGAAGASLASGTWEAVKLRNAPRPVFPDRTPWHSLPVQTVLDRLDASADGLSSEAALQRRRITRGGNGQSSFEPFLAELANPLNPILAVGAGLSAAIGSMVDAGLVLGLIGINAGVGGVQRLRADRALGELLAKTAGEAVALRDGEAVTVSEDDLVRGDVIRLRAGDVLPADCRLLWAEGLEVEEAALTGESLPVAKHAGACPDTDVPERSCMLYEDTTVAAGEGRALVVATGAHTEVARSLASAGPPPPSGVEARLESLTRRLLPGALAAAGGVAGVGLLRRWPVRDIAGTGVSLAVAAVPEGLPFVASAAQIAGARRLAARGAVVRNPRTVEALGRVEVLCFDKTGTLTEGRMRLVAVSDATTTARPDDELGAVHRRVLGAALRASGTPAEDAVLDHVDAELHRAAGELGVTTANGSDEPWAAVHELPFEASRGLHAVIGTVGDERLVVAKGAPETLLDACTHRWQAGGREPLDDAVRALVDEHVRTLAQRGWRLLAVAQRPAAEAEALEAEPLQDLELVGFVALADPVRRTAAEAVGGVREAGVRPVMVTGDHPQTAEAIAHELGLTNGHPVVTGADLDALDDAALAERVDDAAVFARVTPEQKVRIVQALQRRGRAVAMTGDGANDAAAIRLADVGVALGERATAAARDAADLVIADHRIETLIAAITEGRALWGSVRSALAVLVGGNLGEIGFTGFTSLFSRRAPLSPRQFLLVNLFTDLAPAVAIAIRPPAERRPERLRQEGPERSLGVALSRDMTVRGAATATGASLAWTSARLTGGRARAGTVGLVALVGTQLGQTMLAGGLRQPLVLATGLGSAGLLVAAVQTPGVSHFLGCRPLGPLDWTQAVTASAVASVGGHLASRSVERRQRSDVPASQ